MIHANTPSYVGSHVTGFSNMVKGMVKYFSEGSGRRNGKINILPGWVEPSDMEELKRLAKLMEVRTILFPDTSGVMNGPLTGEYTMFPDAGATVEDIKDSGNSMGTLALGEWASADAARLLDTKCKVPCRVLDLPIGLAATDRFVDAMRMVAGTVVPDSIAFERGQLVDLISDYHQWLYGKKVALVGDPDQLIALTEFLVSLDMVPAHVITGTPGKRFEERISEIAPGANVKAGQQADMFLLHQWMQNEPVDLIIGNTYCKYMARDLDIPLVRHGFPILDRPGHQYFPTVGYKGAMRLVEAFLAAFLDRKDRDDPEETFELVI